MAADDGRGSQRGERQSAADQLAEIARRSGTASAEYGDLAGHIARYDAELGGEGDGSGGS